jgi:hypothetical protein
MTKAQLELLLAIAEYLQGNPLRKQLLEDAIVEVEYERDFPCSYEPKEARG